MERRAELHPYELMCSGLNIGVGLILQTATPLAPEDIQRALAITAVEHPYLRHGIVQDGERQVFKDFGASEFSVEVAQKPSSAARAHLEQLINRPRANSRALTLVELYSPSNPALDSAVLYVVFNHAGLDGPGVFHILDSFLTHLAELSGLQGADEIEQADDKCLQDALSRVPEDLQDISRIQPPAEFMPALSALPLEEQATEVPSIRGTHFELTREETNSLLVRCRSCDATVQGAVSAAAAIGMVKVQRRALPQTLCLQAPVNMRQYVTPPLDPRVCVCGSSALWWVQGIQGAQELLQVAAECTRNIKAAIDNRSGFSWWKWLQAEYYAPPVTVMASSMGVIPVKDRYGAIAVLEVLFQGGSYGDLDTSGANVMTHAYTFSERLHVVVSTSDPMVGPQRAACFASAQETILKHMASSGSATAAEFAAGSAHA